MARYISLLALSKDVPGMIINRYCGSGLEAIHLACARVHAGTADCIIAGGTESMSMVPMNSLISFEVILETYDHGVYACPAASRGSLQLWWQLAMPDSRWCPLGILGFAYLPACPTWTGLMRNKDPSLRQDPFQG